MKNLRLKRHFSLVAHGPDHVELRFGVWNPISFTLADETRSGHLFNLLSRLDGSRSAEALAKETNAPRVEVEKLFDALIEMDVVETEPTTALEHYLDHLVPTLRQAGSTNSKELPILLVGSQELTSAISRHLAEIMPDSSLSIVSEEAPGWKLLQSNDLSWVRNGLALQQKLQVFDAWRDHLVIFATKVIDPVAFQIMNRVSLAHRIPWIHAAIDGPFLFIGPTFIPYRSACYECFERRVVMNLREEASYQSYKRLLVEGQVRKAPLPIAGVLSGLLAAHASLEAINFTKTGHSFTINQVLALYLPTMEFSFNEVLRIPGCAGCGSSSERDTSELYFDMSALWKK